MLGAIAGDVIGSVHERRGTKQKDFPLFVSGSRFTDDSVLTCAVAERLLYGGDYGDCYHDWFRAYPMAGYGGTFFRWALHRRKEPYGSWGNGSAMRVSPVGMLAESVAEALAEAEASAAVTHNHPDGIRGAQATALAIHLARTGHDKPAIRRQVEDRFGYRLDQPLDEIRETYRFDVSCQGSVPQSIIAFLESDDFEDAVRNAISLGGDADTMACVAGGIAEAYYGGVPEPIKAEVITRLGNRLRAVVQAFYERLEDHSHRPGSL
jgi:ADP-ribosylglycohydrolase